MNRLRCPDENCLTRTNSSLTIIIRFGFYQTRWGKRSRFRCKGCGRTFCRNSGTVYHRLRHRRAMFDQVAALSVEGVNKSAIVRVQQIAWNTVDRWLEKAAAACRLFNHQRTTKIRIRELQADELCTLVGGKEQPPVWVFAAIDVWSRLWPSTVVGKRSYRNTLTLFRGVCARKPQHIARHRPATQPDATNSEPVTPAFQPTAQPRRHRGTETPPCGMNGISFSPQHEQFPYRLKLQRLIVFYSTRAAAREVL